MNKKGVVLAITMVVLAVLLVLTAAYFSSLIHENKAVNTQKAGTQSLLLSEAGANHALSELKHRIRDDLNTNVGIERLGSTFSPYVVNNTPLLFLQNYAYNLTAAPADTQFAIAGSKATLVVTDASVNLNKGYAGSYSATITVEADGAPTNPATDVFLFPYKFSIISQGILPQGSTPQIARNIQLRAGTFSIRVRRQPFARFALFTELQQTPSGVNVWFTENTNFTGPVNTNGRFNFANNPSGHFTEEATQHEARARFYNNGSSVLLDSDHNGTRDVPTFDKGFERGQDAISLDTSVSQSDVKNEALGGGTVPTSTGVYVPNSGGCVTGGIYVRGSTSSSSDDSIITMSTDASNNPEYTITQVIAGVTTTKKITVNYATNQTIVAQTTAPVSSNTYCGLPDGIHNEGTIIYSNDTVKSFSGTVQEASRVTVCSEKDLVITNNVRYQDYTASPLSAEGYDNNLGIISWGGNVRIGTAAPNNLDIHGIVMAPVGIFTVDNYASGSPRGTVNLLGGAITEHYGAFGTFSGTNPISGYGRNFVYDIRMLSGIAPPYFPFMPFFMSGEEPPQVLDNKLDWEDQDQS